MISLRRVLARPERCLGCLAREVACIVSNGAPSRFVVRSGIARRSGAIRGLDEGQVQGIRAFRVRCHQCEEAKCLVACATRAIERSDSGVVPTDAERCTCCGICVMICPYGAIFIDKGRGRTAKRELCLGKGSPACVDSCQPGALILEE